VTKRSVQPKPQHSKVLSAYQTHVGSLKHFISRILGTPQDIDDVVQEAFLRAYDAERAKPIEQPKSFLFKIAKNVALNQVRSNSRRPTDYLEDVEPLSVPDDEWTLEDEMVAREKIGMHCAAVAALPPQCRKVYLMRKVYALTYREIAEALDISVSTVETHLERGFARCQAHVVVKTLAR